MVQAPFFEGLVTSKIPDGPVSMEGACNSINLIQPDRETAVVLEKLCGPRRSLRCRLNSPLEVRN